MLIAGLIMNATGVAWFQNNWVQLGWYILAFLPVGLGVMKEACTEAASGDIFSEFMLMSIAAIGAFAIGEYAEGVAVMLLYCIGETLQDNAVDKARGHIESLAAFRPDKAWVMKNGFHDDWKGFEPDEMDENEPENVKIGQVIVVRPGERVPLDGVLLSVDAAFNTSALTGESVPRLIAKGSEVLAGMIATDSASCLRVTRPASDSAVSRILNMVEEASERKAPAELFVRKFARIYTPVVIALAALLVLVPWIWSILQPNFTFIFTEWFRRALVFLVISCPCALVVSIPLSYFAGIGAASRRGILFKGSNYLDMMTQLDAVVLDKTGTLTTGEFAVDSVVGLSAQDLDTVARMELTSSHPIAKAVCRYVFDGHTTSEQHLAADVKNVPGYGLSAEVGADKWLVGTLRLLNREHISYPEELRTIPETIVVCAKNGHFIGYILLADTLKSDAKAAIDRLKAYGLKTEILSGDKQPLVNKVAEATGVEKGYGDLLPQEKVAHIEKLQKAGLKVAFAGDGINDAPVLALSDVGLAMGALGADMAIETADVIIQTDQPSKIADSIAISRRTRSIVKQNILMSIGIKILVMLLGVLGVATLWEAVFADSGVALLAVLNSVRIFLSKDDESSK